MGRHLGRHLPSSTNYVHVCALYIFRRCAPSITGATRSRDLLHGQYKLTVPNHVYKIPPGDASLLKLTNHHSSLKDSMLLSGVQD